MNPILTASALAAAIALSGCAGATSFLTAPQGEGTIGANILKDLQGCSRDYRGALAPTNISGAFTIVCAPIVKDGFHLEPVAGVK